MALLIAANSETLKGGAVGGLAGLGVGVAGVMGAGVRYPAFRQLTLPLRAFLCTSSATFGGMGQSPTFLVGLKQGVWETEGHDWRTR